MKKLLIALGVIAGGVVLVRSRKRLFLWRGLQEPVPPKTDIVRISADSAEDAIAGMRYWFGIAPNRISNVQFSGKLDEQRHRLWDVYLVKA